MLVEVTLVPLLNPVLPCTIIMCKTRLPSPLGSWTQFQWGPCQRSDNAVPLYSDCDNDGGSGTTIELKTGTVAYDRFCPCFDAAGSNMGTNIQELPALSSTEIYYTVNSTTDSSSDSTSTMPSATMDSATAWSISAFFVSACYFLMFPTVSQESAGPSCWRDWPLLFASLAPRQF